MLVWASCDDYCYDFFYSRQCSKQSYDCKVCRIYIHVAHTCNYLDIQFMSLVWYFGISFPEKISNACTAHCLL